MPAPSSSPPGTPEDSNQLAAKLLEEVYEELRKLAASRMAREQPGQTLQATALVHEAWIKLTSGNEQQWHNKAHFFASAAEAMRRIVIDQARRKGRVKHGGQLRRIDFDKVEFALETEPEVLLELNECIETLAEEFPEKAKLVKLRFFTGLQLSEAADALGISLATAKRYWTFSRAWLYAALTEKQSADH